ncbi:hypothetical protein BAX97_11625 [Elizabethkingia meningoseptica]|uniref:hypothetical protein n=1 Tax=Elizabethkingia meningoseptica TaxID=238 RepID=UPI000332C68B|nr:hypothetical protein [Elizabethkingia meningoseptica]AQX03811.1 hypothetical protein BBD33_00460 [Elizabethkingia meningoseptica]AQX45850.1 hypothetical protein B5G46_00460 [Elizabethkingia meningoseptica]EJK5329836.1 hypothetical protein [Elizabethkingia meningoseptica]EOR30129.1 hypothetical protein L100_07814 [Elizabethkingia meningoseptica ATCC 13253 = NBRC 12535]KUY15143.1 hypothetical protein ATB99_11655 [Elizabethkingia meningoseptica]
MPTIKHFSWRVLFFPVLLLAFFSCKKTQVSQVIHNDSSEKIESISLTTEGGELGYFRNITITKDSVLFVQRQIAPSQVDNTKKTTISAQEWNTLVSDLDIQKFSKIKNGQSYQPVDGTDDIWEIKTSLNHYHIVNGNIDTVNYKPLKVLQSRLEELIQKK